MKDQGIENLLKNLKAPAPDPEARLRAKRAALAEFARTPAANNLALDADEITAGQIPAHEDTVQEREVSPRLSREHHSHGSASMKRFATRNWYAAAAGLGVVAIGLTWVLPNLSRYGEELATPELMSAPAPEGETGSLRGAASTSSTDDRDDAAAAANAQATPPDAAEPSSQGHELEGRLRKENGDAARQANAEQARADAQADRERDKLESFAQAKSRAQTAEAPEPLPPPPAPMPSQEIDAIVVSGMRANKQPVLETKRSADAAYAPSVAGSLQRVQGISEQNALANVMAYKEEGRDRFEHFDANPVNRVSDTPVSTFSADVDTASYGFVRGRLSEGVLPQKDAVRVEEMVNYFDYSWPAANSRRAPFEPTVVVSDSPWGKGRKLVHIGIKGYEIDRDEAPDANLVLLLDVSGSMNEPNKLPLAVRSMEMLLESLKPRDTVGIVVYAGAAGTVLEPTPVSEKEKIVAALRSLRPGGSTAGAAGIERAYQLAEAHFRKGGVNRILLATDGDFNVGIHDTRELTGFVERKREKGVYLSVLGFGSGNYRDELAQALAQNGNGVAAYIDTENEARKVLVQEASSSLFTIAKDVKLQVEFNPATVSEYRLVGYETRALKREDFNNDAVDAGDVGAGHTVTAIYEITPVGAQMQSVDEPRYEENRLGKRSPAETRGSRNEYGFLKIRYKLPGEKESQLLSEPIPLRTGGVSSDVKRDVAFSTAVAGFAQLLRGGTYTGSLSYEDVIEQAQSAKGEDRFGYRAEFIELVRKARDAAKE